MTHGGKEFAFRAIRPLRFLLGDPELLLSSLAGEDPAHLITNGLGEGENIRIRLAPLGGEKFEHRHNLACHHHRESEGTDDPNLFTDLSARKVGIFAYVSDPGGLCRREDSSGKPEARCE